MIKPLKKLPKLQDCIEAGKFLRPHDNDGKLLVKVNISEFLQNPPKFLFVEIDSIVIPFSLQENSIQKKNQNTVIIKLLEVSNEEEAKYLVGKEFYIFDKKRIKSKPEAKNQNVLNTLVGYMIVDKVNGKVGEILSTKNYSGSINFEIRYKNKIILYPRIDENIVEIDHIHKKIIVSSSPQGIFDL